MREQNRFWLDGACCLDYGLVLQGPVTFSGAGPRVSTVSVPGRNGDLHFFEGAYSNLAGQASCYALDGQDIARRLDGITAWLLCETGYRRLEVSQEPEVYRLARVVLGPENDIRMRRLAPFAVTFDCKPQKFLKAGERAVKLAQSGGVLHNPYTFTALPKITVYGTGPGALQVGGTEVQVKALDGWVVLDSEMQNAYKGTQNKNSTINAPEFPSLQPGNNAVSWTGGITRVEIVPGWWTL